MTDDLRKAAGELLEQMETIFGDDSAWQKEMDALRAALAAPTPEPTQKQSSAAWALAHAAGYEAGYEANSVSGFYEDEFPTFRQGAPKHELEELVTAEEVQGYVQRIQELKAERDALRAALKEKTSVEFGWHENPVNHTLNVTFYYEQLDPRPLMGWEDGHGRMTDALIDALMRSQ